MAANQNQDVEPGGPRGLRGFLKTTAGKVIAALGTGVGIILGVVAANVLPPLIERLTDPDPVRIVTETNLDKLDVEGSPAEGSYVIQKPIEDLGSPPAGADECVGRYAWAHALGGVDADHTGVRVVVEGLWSSPVIINGFHPRVVRQAAPTIGTHITCPPKGGEVADVRFLTVELRKSGATYKYHPRKSDASKSFAFSLSKGQTELFYIDAKAMDCDCEWVADLDLIVDGRKRTATVTNGGNPFKSGGNPFRTSASTNAKSYVWSGEKWADAGIQQGPINNPTTGHIQAPKLTACSLITKDDLEQLFGQTVSEPKDEGLANRGGVVPRIDSICGYQLGGPDKQALPSMILVDFAGTRSAADAKADYADRKPRYLGSSRWRTIPGIGDEAVATERIVYARKGAQTIAVSLTLSRPDAIANAQPQLLRLAKLAAKRAWG